MTEADTFEAPKGGTFHERLLEAVTEAFAGNGIKNNSDALTVADTNTAMKIDVSSATKLRYGGSSYSPSADSFTLSNGPSTTTNGEDDRRVDMVYFDADTASYDVVEGAPDPNPTAPETPANGLMLALVEVGHDVSDVETTSILNWRSRPSVEFPVGTSDVADAAITDSKIANDAVKTAKIAAEAVETAKIADDAITTAKVADNAITNSELDTDAVNTSQIVDAAVETAKIADDAITTAKIVNSAVDTSEMSDSAITTAKLAASAVATGAIENGAVTDEKIDANTTISRGKIDDRVVTIDTASDIITSNEETILVDTVTSGSPTTITLASADVEDGNKIQIIDTGGSAKEYPITVNTEGSETIDGETSFTIDMDHGGVVVISDGSTWYTAGGASGGGTGVSENTFTTDSSGTVQSASSGVMHIIGLEDGETLNISQSALLLADGQPAPSGLRLILATLDNSGGASEEIEILAGDGATIFDDESGVPLASYENNSGGHETVALLIDNGDFGSGTGASQDVFAGSVGLIQ